MAQDPVQASADFLVGLGECSDQKAYGRGASSKVPAELVAYQRTSSATWPRSAALAGLITVVS